jgi:hypothetical protein
VYFTSEAEAWQRESTPPPAEMAQAMQGELMDHISYLDLHQPWPVSPTR